VLPRQLLSDHVYALLRGWIVGGELLPGQRLVESEIARKVGTSQAPAREAIKRLAHEGLVISQPHLGTYVASVSPREAQEVRDIRVMFEAYAARPSTWGCSPRTWRGCAAPPSRATSAPSETRTCPSIATSARRRATPH
jgi:DNA-binding transcriptional MocR family regulator